MAILNNNPLIGASGQSKGYRIERSLRFNSADSAYLNRTPASAGSRTTWTWSAWIKRSAITANSPLFSVSQSANDFTLLRFGPGTQDKLELYTVSFPSGSSIDYSEETVALFRDVSAWYHVVFSVDTTQATAANRIRIYVNGIQQATTQTYGQIPQNENTFVNTTNAHNIGRNTDSTTQHFNGYMTEINFIDGQQLTPSSFGETDADTGVWKPKAYSGSYGTNGFYLKFADNSDTTSTTLGKDSSGNSNNWTPNNFYVGPGSTNAEKAGIDSLVDSPTQYGTDTGAGGEVRGNYCTLNPLNRAANGTMSDGNLQVSDTSSAAADTSTGTISMKSGKYYFEFTRTSANNASYYGIIREDKYISGQAVGMNSGDYGYNLETGGTLYSNGSSTSSWITAISANDVGMVAYDADTGKVWFGRNGTWGGSGNPASGTNAAATVNSFSTFGYLPWLRVIGDAGTETSVVNFGQRPFAYTAPSGFKALCTTNLPTPTIGATATTQADNYFNVVARTFTGASASITGLGFNPDFLWFKRRNSAASHSLFDKVRGNTKRLLSNGTNAEITTTSDELTSFDSDGFTVGADTGSISVNGANGDTGVVWCWRGNGAGSSNTQGTITSTVSANTTAGFSIVTYTGNGVVGATRGHGLGVAPNMIFVKGRGNDDNWHVYHSAAGNTGGLFLNKTDAFVTSSFFWNDTSPTSTVFTTSSGASNNSNGVTYVAYCFAAVAGYSAFGSYTGNGSTDGPFIYTGFRPKYVLIKPSSAADSWQVEDAARSPFNVVNDQLWPNLSDAEQVDSTTRQTDFLSNGFKIRGTNTGVNGNGTTYVYACFAESPFKYSLAR